MHSFTKTEFRLTILILITIFFVTFSNLKISERKARDFQRRDDLAQIYNALHRFHDDFGFFPSSAFGKILACKGPNFNTAMKNIDPNDEVKRIEIYLANLKACEWGQDGLKDLSNDNFPPYIKTLPADTYRDKGFSYYYVSNNRVFQLYAFLEGGEAEIGYDSEILERKLPCGSKLCNFGRSAFGKTPLNMTLDEYEKKLKEHPEFDVELEQKRVN